MAVSKGKSRLPVWRQVRSCQAFTVRWTVKGKPSFRIRKEAKGFRFSRHGVAVEAKAYGRQRKYRREITPSGSYLLFITEKKQKVFTSCREITPSGPFLRSGHSLGSTPHSVPTSNRRLQSFPRYQLAEIPSHSRDRSYVGCKTSRLPGVIPPLIPQFCCFSFHIADGKQFIRSQTYFRLQQYNIFYNMLFNIAL